MYEGLYRGTPSIPGNASSGARQEPAGLIKAAFSQQTPFDNAENVD